MTDPQLTDAADEAADDAERDDDAPAWRPLSARQAGDATWHETLFDGVPEHLLPSVVWWIDAAGRTTPARDEYPGEVVARINRRARRTIATLSGKSVRAVSGEELEVIDVLLHLIDAEISKIEKLSYRDPSTNDRGRELNRHVVTLNHYLAEAGSLWTVGEIPVPGGTTYGLIERVGKAVQDQADLILSGQSSAAIHLQRAWGGLYGRHPDYAKALDEAGRAIEAVAFPVICPSDTKATLSKAARALRDGAHKHKWTCAFGTLEQLAGRMQAFYDAQQRHGVANVADMKEVGRELAEAAVHEAITLVQWFRSGVITRVESGS